MSRLVETFQMLDILSSRNIVSIKELSETLGVNARTVQRIRDDLEYLGYRIETLYGPGGGYQLRNTSQVHPLAFTHEEAQHIRNGLKTLMSLQDTSYGSDFVLSIAKLHHQFDTKDDLVSVSAFKSVRLNVDGEVYHNHINQLEVAIEAHRRVTIEYQKNPRSQKQYIFEPYEMVLLDQLWYVNGYERGGRQLSLRVSRIAHLIIRDDFYLVDDQYSSRSIMSEYGFRIKPVRIHVSISNRDYFSEYIWGEAQNIEWVDDTTYELQVTFPNELVAKAFVLEGGACMKVLEPKSLQTWIVDEAKNILQRYV